MSGLTYVDALAIRQAISPACEFGGTPSSATIPPKRFVMSMRLQESSH